MKLPVHPRITPRKLLLLDALVSGPGYAKQIFERVAATKDERVAVKGRHAYSDMRALERDGLVRSFDVSMPSLGGRVVRHYSITATGAAIVTSHSPRLARAS